MISSIRAPFLNPAALIESRSQACARIHNELRTTSLDSCLNHGQLTLRHVTSAASDRKDDRTNRLDLRARRLPCHSAASVLLVPANLENSIMTAAQPPEPPPFDQPHLPLRDPYSEFASERPAAVESDGLTHRASLPGVAIAPGGSPVRRRESRDRWVVGALMLGIGLVVGFAAGIAVVTDDGRNQNAAVPSLASNRADSKPLPGEARGSVDRPAEDRIGDAAHDSPRTTATDAATTGLDVPSRGQPTSPKSENKMPESPVAVLYVQSRPAGAEVYLDGQLVSTTPFQLSGVTVGRHIIQINLRGYRTWSTPVSVEPGARVRIAAALEQ